MVPAVDVGMWAAAFWTLKLHYLPSVHLAVFVFKTLFPNIINHIGSSKSKSTEC